MGDGGLLQADLGMGRGMLAEELQAPLNKHCSTPPSAITRQPYILSFGLLRSAPDSLLARLDCGGGGGEKEDEFFNYRKNDLRRHARTSELHLRSKTPEILHYL